MTRNEYNNGVSLWADDVYRYAVHCCGDREQSKDFVQAAFATLREKRESVATEKGKAFLLAVVHNHVMSHFRHEAVYRENADVLKGDQVTEPDEAFDLHEAIQKAMDALPQVQREAVMLKDIEGYDVHEISEILSISENQVRVYVFRARVSMKKTLIALGYDGNN